jgi:glycosyltransferase involved in cell wall biosynthesis
VPAADLNALYRLARAVVVPTRFEAASGPLWEAFQAGTPAACSNVTSLPDQAGDAALLFDPDRVDQIADAVRALWTDDALRATLVERGTANIKRFSWDLTARTYRAWYRKLAGRTLNPVDLALIEAPALL